MNAENSRKITGRYAFPSEAWEREIKRQAELENEEMMVFVGMHPQAELGNEKRQAELGNEKRQVELGNERFGEKGLDIKDEE